MSLNGLSFKQDGSVLVPTDGTATAIQRVRSLSNGEVCVFGGVNVADRSEITVSVKEPTQNASSPGGFSPQRVTITLKQPYVTASGETFVNRARFEGIWHREVTDQQKASTLGTIAQLLVHADAQPLFYDLVSN